MAHGMYTTHHIPTRWVAFAIAVVLVMASVVWVVAFSSANDPLLASIGIGRRSPHPHRIQYPPLNTHGQTGRNPYGLSESPTCQVV